MKITVPCNITLPVLALQNGTARRRSGISTFLKHLALCVVLGVITLLVADGGGPVFLAGAIATAIALGMLMKRVFRFSLDLRRG